MSLRQGFATAYGSAEVSLSTALIRAEKAGSGSRDDRLSGPCEDRSEPPERTTVLEGLSWRPMGVYSRVPEGQKSFSACPSHFWPKIRIYLSMNTGVGAAGIALKSCARYRIPTKICSVQTASLKRSNVKSRPSPPADAGLPVLEGLPEQDRLTAGQPAIRSPEPGVY